MGSGRSILLVVVLYSQAVATEKKVEFLSYKLKEENAVNQTLKILHVVDTHFNLRSDSSPWSDRMHKAFLKTEHYVTGTRTFPKREFLSALEQAKAENVDLIALGGDLLNFPSKESMKWALTHLKEAGVPFVYTSGNHDWHLEQQQDWETMFDSQRLPTLQGHQLYDMYTHSGQGFQERNFTDPRFGYVVLRGGLLVVCIDNSNFQVDDEQLAFFVTMLIRNQPMVLVMHIPIVFPGLPNWPVQEVMGHPKWGRRSDPSADLEGRLPWPSTGEMPNRTDDFIKAVKEAAESEKLLAVLTGHTHENAIVHIPCSDASTRIYLTARARVPKMPSCPQVCPDGRSLCSRAKQFTTLPNAVGGTRLFEIHLIGSRVALSRDEVPFGSLPRIVVFGDQLLVVENAAAAGMGLLILTWLIAFLSRRRFRQTIKD
eukprot:gnl/MRDRNA2_/MRDRNA2_31077_c0_seq1.p1 gnl/MRDRNA2_/MRDRNA2_31077_c0~~gnl/MRDRNA2_/MRDRNA2_31077_c0_seq1.p1  ORF type:complete len:428 (+),score=53.59 gnl/MRDRNA2_/MRDRNA2_31077_c0_seq1:160-1443(+)